MVSRESPSVPEWQVVLDKIESQKRLTIDAIEASRAILEDGLDAAEGRLGGRIGKLETAVTLRPCCSFGGPALIAPSTTVWVLAFSGRLRLGSGSSVGASFTGRTVR